MSHQSAVCGGRLGRRGKRQHWCSLYRRVWLRSRGICEFTASLQTSDRITTSGVSAPPSTVKTLSLIHLGFVTGAKQQPKKAITSMSKHVTTKSFLYSEGPRR